MQTLDFAHVKAHSHTMNYKGETNSEKVDCKNDKLVAHFLCARATMTAQGPSLGKDASDSLKENQMSKVVTSHLTANKFEQT